MKIETDEKNLVRDTNSKALLNRDTVYRDQIQMAREKARKAAQLETRVTELEATVKELTHIVRGIKT